VLITPEYAELNRQMHESRAYGVEGQKWVHVIKQMVEAYDTQDILDYGSGKCSLEKALGYPIHNYDPAIPGLEATPEPADIVVCGDVLEHIEPECLEAVLIDLRRCTKKVMFAIIATTPAIKALPDGTNPHRIIKPWEWWIMRMHDRFRMTNFSDYGKRFMYIAEPR
jgi:2-polyprenyl-3-methyl-5-hydroxy-6-metoxy-1,4-benzoquinol methylase